MDEISYGYCHCGCGDKTQISNWTDKRYGSIKGKPRRFINGHHTRRNARSDGLKLCIGCNQEKSLKSDFYPEKAKRDGHSTLCRPCSKTATQTWCENNRERRRAIVKRHDDSHRQQRKIRARRNRKNNPRRYAAYARSYYAKKKGAKGFCTDDQLVARLEMFGYLCWICKKEPGKEVDHVIAINNGGSDWPANLRPACRHCNATKSDRDWRPYVTKETP